MKRVMVFTASGTFRGQEGKVVEQRRDGAAMVQVDGELAPMLFKSTELVPLDPEPHVAGAE